jgi:uncharacterized membrane protein YeaQ/YmgE (transglycosylase-associated protein family)
MHVLWAIIAGLVIGLLAKLLVRGRLRGRHRIPLWLTTLLGICGALVGDAISSGIGVRHTSGIDWTRHVLQVVAAAALIGIVAPLWNLRDRHLR